MELLYFSINATVISACFLSVDLLDNLSIFFVQKVTFIYKYLAIVGDTIESIC